MAGQTLNQIKWQTPIDTSNSGSFAHYGQPLISSNNTVFVPVMGPAGSNGFTFTINVFDGATGTQEYTLSTDYILPSYSWIPMYQPCLTNGTSGKRLYYPGAGGTVYYVDNADSASPSSPTQVCFYGLSNYQSNASGFNSTVFIDTPITADSSGNIFFGFRVQGTAPAPLNTSVSGWARIDSTGTGTYVLCDAMTGVANMTRDSHNCAPALSNDESTLYVVAKDTSSSYSAYLCGLDSTTLATKYKVHIVDPRPSGAGAGPIDESTASPMVGPDGDVYVGMFVTPYNGSRGILMHYSGDLSQTKTPGAFGWDYTPAIVPANLVPSYHGTSSYLLFCKYNNYTGTGQDDGGDGVNTLAILDPNDETQIDWHPYEAGMTEMREVMTVIGCTPDIENPSLRDATREWCVNATAVDSSTGTVFFNSEDGNTYRWDLSSNSLAQVLNLTTGFGAPYVPQGIGPDGTVYTFNGTYLFADGEVPGVTLTLDSSSPDNRYTVSGDTLTFTANVGGGSSTPTGTVTFTDFSYLGYNSGTSSFDTQTVTSGPIPVINGVAQWSTSPTSDLTGSNDHHGSHFITATYSGDSSHPAASITRVQKVHSNASTLTLTATPNTSPYGQPVTLTATVNPQPTGSGTPSGYVFFHLGNTALGQIHLDGSATASLSTSTIPYGSQTITADYFGDSQFAASSGTTTVDVAGVSNVTAAPLKFRSGMTSTGTVTISPAAPAAGTVVTLAGNNFVSVPSSVTVPNGATTANFTITGTNSGYSDGTGTVTASIGTSSKSKNMIVQPNNQSTWVSQSVPSSMTAGQQYPVSVVFKNTGTTTWDTAHGYDLYSTNPNNNTIWGVNRLPLSNGPVAPGSNGTFSGTVTAPSSPGTYNFQWLCYEESDSMLFGAKSLNVAVTVGNGTDGSQYISETTVPTSVGPSTTFDVSFSMKNTGTSVWSALGGYTLSPTAYNWGVSNITSPTVNPGSTASFPAGGPQTFTAPSTPGTYTFQWRMQHNSTQFGDSTPSISIVVSNDAAQYISGNPPSTINCGTDFSLTYTMKNTGITTWTAASGYSLLSIVSPAYTWGPTKLNISNGTISPGQQATLTATCTAPMTPGTYSMQWQMNKSGTVFGEKTPLLSINVTQGPDGSQFVSTSAPTSVGPSTTFSGTITMKNTGTATWDSNYSLAATPNVWGVASIPVSSSVAPNSNGVFTATFTAPATPGTYSFRFRMQHGTTKFGQASGVYNIVVAADAAVYVSSTVPTSVNAGNDFAVTYLMRNTGTTTWSSGGGYSMLTLNPLNNTTFGANRLTLGGSVSPGSQTTFSRTLTAPITPGTYTLQWQMNKSGTVFGQATPSVSITVVNGPDNAQFVSQTVPTSVAHGATFSATITMKNIGTGTWTGPTYALKSFGSSNFGIPSIASGSVAPNANGVFTATFTAPSTPGNYTFIWRMVDGSARFGQATKLVTITVT